MEAGSNLQLADFDRMYHSKKASTEEFCVFLKRGLTNSDVPKSAKGRSGYGWRRRMISFIKLRALTEDLMRNKSLQIIAIQ